MNPDNFSSNNSESLDSPLPPQQEGEPLLTSGAHRSHRNTIDYSKFKTKMCRHYAMGQQCPFEDRCAFAHGEQQVAPPPPPPSYDLFVTHSSANPPESPMDTSSDTPPAYPSRFRYDPYSPSSIIFVN